MSRLLTYFRKEVNVHVDYLYTDGINRPETFNVYVIHKNKAGMLTNLVWDEIDRLVEALEKENKPLQLWREYGMGKEILDVPKWARPRLAAKLRETKRREEEKLRKETEAEHLSYEELKVSEEKANFFGYPMLISGLAGAGKTMALKKILSELLKEGNRVAVVDFRNDYEDVVEKHQGISLTSDEVHLIEGEERLVRIHFGDDVFYQRKNYDIEFLSALAIDFDYLFVDDTEALYQESFNLGSASSLYDVLAPLIKKNLNLKIVLSLQSLYHLAEEDKESLDGLFGHRLLFRQTRAIEMNNHPELLELELGEAVFYMKKKPKWVIDFKE